ncbi:hypothetical protein ACOSQ2_010229 [Xanthoceras sorbifolium]
MLSFLVDCRAQLSTDQFLLFACILWQIWNYRNSIIYSRKCLMLVDIVLWCNSFLVEFNEANYTAHLQRVSHFVQWIPPDSGLIKVNTDAAINSTIGKTGLGVVICNNFGEVLMAWVDVLEGALAPDMAEAKAILFGLSIACQSGLKVDHLEYDASTIISMLNKRSVRLSAIGLIVDDISNLLRHFNCVVEFSHVPRIANRVAHSLAKFAFVEDQQLVWVEDFPPCGYSFRGF